MSRTDLASYIVVFLAGLAVGLLLAVAMAARGWEGLTP